MAHIDNGPVTIARGNVIVVGGVCGGSVADDHIGIAVQLDPAIVAGHTISFNPVASDTGVDAVNARAVASSGAIAARITAGANRIERNAEAIAQVSVGREIPDCGAVFPGVLRRPTGAGGMYRIRLSSYGHYSGRQDFLIGEGEVDIGGRGWGAGGRSRKFFGEKVNQFRARGYRVRTWGVARKHRGSGSESGETIAAEKMMRLPGLVAFIVGLSRVADKLQISVLLKKCFDRSTTK